MHRLLLFCWLVLMTFPFYGQDIEPAYTFEFENTPLKEALLKIQSQTAYQLFFLDDWMQDEVVIGSFSNLKISELLEVILKDTSLNFVIIDKQIFLTLGTIVVTDLPIAYFDIDTTTQLNETIPIAVNLPYSDNEKTAETVIISKQKEGRTKGVFTLKGKVLNINTGEPIGNLTINVEGTNTFAITDIEGSYSIDLQSGENIITAQALGVEASTKRIVMYGDGEYNFNLSENVEMLDDVYINAQAQSNVRQTLAGVSTIEVEQIKTIPLVLGERDILKVATTLPGITSAGEGAIGYNVRGGKVDQNLFLLDGATIYNPSHFFGIFSALNPFTSGAVDIYKGSIPAKYGGRLASVFDISTKSANKEKLEGEVSIGPVTGNVTLEVPVVKDKSGIIIGGRATYSDWILRNLDNPDLQQAKASFYDVIAKYDHKFNEKHSLSATGYRSSDVFNITIDSLYSYNNTLAAINWNKTISENKRSNLKLSHSRYEFGIEYESGANNDFDFEFDLQETEISYGLNMVVNNDHNVDFGIATKLYGINPGNIRPIGEASTVLPFRVKNERGLESALYVSDEWDVNEKISLNAGLRLSMFNFLGETIQRVYAQDSPVSNGTVIGVETFGNNELVKTYGGPELRLSARYLFNPTFSIRAAYNTTLQYIHTLSNNTTASPIDTWKLSDKFIKPQRSQQYSLGVFKNLSGNKYELSLEGYYKNLDNILDYKVGGQLILNEFVETEVLQGKGKAYGVEFLLRKNEGDLTGYLGYSYSRILYQLDSPFPEERVNNGEYYPANYDIPHQFSMVLNYKLTKRFSFSGNVVYQTGRPITYPVGQFQEGGNNYVLYSDRNQFRIPDYFRVDLGFNIEGNHKIKKFAHSFWNISVYNVLGRNNPYSTFFVSDSGEVKAYQTSIFAVPVPTITYNFRF